MSARAEKITEKICAAEQRGNPAKPHLRVLHLINTFEIGGTERQAVELLKRLDRQQYDVRLAALRTIGPLYEEIAALYPNLQEFTFDSFHSVTAVKQLLRLRALMIRERIDILHAHDFYAGLLGTLAAQFTEVRVIACQRHLRLSDRRVHRWGRTLINRLADRILVNADAIRDHIIHTGDAHPEKIVVIQNGFAPHDYSPGVNSTTQEESQEAGETSAALDRALLRRELGLEAESKIVGIVANLRTVKGHLYLIQAAPSILRVHPQAHFVLIGEGETRGEIEALAARLGVKDRVHLLGHRVNASRLAAGFDLAVLASLHEGMPNTVMEAMAAGVAVVSTAVGGATEIITDGETGFLVPPANSELLAERIIALLSDDLKRAVMAERGKEAILNKFGMKRMVRSVENLYNELAVR